MYAIRSYYAFHHHIETIRVIALHFGVGRGLIVGGDWHVMEGVITSYSIHYTKLYDTDLDDDDNGDERIVVSVTKSF